MCTGGGDDVSTTPKRITKRRQTRTAMPGEREGERERERGWKKSTKRRKNLSSCLSQLSDLFKRYKSLYPSFSVSPSLLLSLSLFTFLVAPKSSRLTCDRGREKEGHEKEERAASSSRGSSTYSFSSISSSSREWLLFRLISSCLPLVFFLSCSFLFLLFSFSKN